MSKTKNIVYTANFTALGVLLPLFSTHIIGLPGGVLSPMHLPVLLAGLICGSFYGMICGVLSPCLSTLLTGMPPAWPMLPAMVIELVVYGAVSGLLFKKLRLPIYIALPVSMIVGRIFYGVAFMIFTSLHISLLPASIWTSAVTGLPGIIIQLVLIPVIIIALGIAPKKHKKKDDEEALCSEKGRTENL